ncbi:MAG: hypothetical protein WD036_03145 [Bauldia sp.]
MTESKDARRAERQKRLAAALRANLKRRKAAAPPAPKNSCPPAGHDPRRERS